MRVFLGGTCADSKWRDQMKTFLDEEKIKYFDPVVDDWNEEAQARELQEREKCDFCLYVITPKMQGVYSIAEVVDDSNKRPHKTVFVCLATDDNTKFMENGLKSLKQVGKMVKENGGQVFDNLKDAAKWMGRVRHLLRQEEYKIQYGGVAKW